jgi:alkaline phosphatase D
LLEQNIAMKLDDTETSSSRRRFLRQAAGSGAALLVPISLWGCATGTNRTWGDRNPFTLGVASGEPRPDGFALWTRLAPDPLSSDPATPGGMSGPDVPVEYEVALDDGMRQVVRRGVALAERRYAYSVHVEVGGLAPQRPYWYRFRSGSAESRIGRTMTAAATGSTPARFRLGFVSCSNYEHGYFSAYRHLTEDEPDVVLFLGDYIYEYIDRKSERVRRHSDDVEADTLPTYRNRYAQYRLDEDLQTLHARVPALMTWDDHEVSNDYADRWSQTFDDPEHFLMRRAAAYQAYYEHMPVRPSRSTPQGPALKVYDRFHQGSLVEISMIDGRQYRSRGACYRPPNKGKGHLETNRSCPERLLESRSMIGLEQERWLFDGLAKSEAAWNVIAQDVLMAQLKQRDASGEFAYWTDDWNGYPASRARLIDHIDRSRVRNPVVLGGDIHSFWMNDLKADFDDPNSRTVATEFVGTSVTAHGPPYERFIKYLPDNPHIKFFDSRVHGYAIADITASKMTTQFKSVSDVRDVHATVSTLKQFVVESGRPGAVAT